MEKYIIATTWNGEGYSEQSKAWVREFPSDADALEYLWERFKEEDPNMGSVCESITPDRVKLIFEDNRGNAGTWQYMKWTPDVFGVVIQTNVNEVIVCSESEYRTYLSDAIQETADEDEVFEYHSCLAEKRVFIGYVGDYDLQFVRLSDFENEMRAKMSANG